MHALNAQQAKKLTKEMHIHMSASDYVALKTLADKECRSINAQLLYILRQALDSQETS